MNELLVEMAAFGIPVVLAFALAFLVESTTEYLFGTLFDKVSKLHEYKWLLMYLAGGVGVFVSFHYQLDLIAFLQQIMGVGVMPSPVGIVFTGLTIGRGANYVHQFVSKFFPAKK